MAAQGAWADTQDTRPPSKRAVRRRFALSDLPLLLWRERALIVAVFLAVLALGLAAAFAMKTSYQTHSSLLVRLEPEYGHQAQGGEASRPLGPGSDQLLQSEREILGAGQLPVRVVERLGLSRTYPQLAAKAGKAAPADRPRFVAQAAASIQKNLRIESTPGSPVLRLYFSHDDPRTGAVILNTLLEEYLIYRRSVLLAPNSAALDQQRRLFQARLAQADSAYQDFLVSNQIGDFVAEKAALSALQAQIEQQKYETDVELQNSAGRLAALGAQMEGVAREVRLHRDVTSGPREATRTRTGVNPVYQALQTQKIQLAADVAALERAQATLAEQAGQLKERRLRLAGLEPRFRELSLGRDVLQASVRDLTVRKEQGRAAEEIALLADDSIRIVERAAPATRGVSLRWPIVGLTLLLASLAGLGAGLIRMLMRPGLPTAQVASRTLDLPILGAAAMKPR